MQVLATLAHELIHAALGIEEGHGPNFKRVYKAIGLAGRATATHAGPEFIEAMQPVIAKIGEIPHGIMQSDRGVSTRKKKAEEQIPQMRLS